jgi:hypothetical protein
MSELQSLVERNRVLERAVQRWRLISLALLILLVSSTAISGTSFLIYMLADDSRHELELMRMEDMRAREMAQQQAEMARQAQDAAEQRLQQLQKQGEDQPQPEIDP